MLNLIDTLRFDDDDIQLLISNYIMYQINYWPGQQSWGLSLPS